MKKILCLLMIAALLFSTLPLSASAADTLSPTGTALTATAFVDMNKCVVVTWNAVPGAAYYYLVLTNFNPKNDHFMQIKSGRTVSSLEACTYTFERNYSLDEGYGTDDYRVSVDARDSNGDVIASTESNIIHLGIESLATPTLTFSEDGIARWSSVPHAEEYTVVLRDANGSVVSRRDLNSGYTSFDFSDVMVGGYKYYIVMFATSTVEPYRQSEMVTSETVTYNAETKPITELAWSGNTLHWRAFPNATIYGLWLYKLRGSGYVQHGDVLSTSDTSYDFSALFHEYGIGTYKVKVQARRNSTRIISRDTDSPELIYIEQISSVTVGGITEPVDGAAPNGECKIPKGSGYRATIPNYGYISWYTEDGDLMNPDTDTFEVGKKYSAQVTLITDEGYEFAENGLTGTMNGKDATKSIFVATPKKKIYMSRWFTCYALAEIDTVEVSGVVAPRDGEHPTYAASAPAGAGYAVEDYDDDNCWQNGVCWYHAGSEMSFTDRFIAGETYTAQVSLVSEPGLYCFAASGLSGKLNGKSAAVGAFSPSTAAENIYVQYTFTCSSGVLLGDADTDGEVTILDATAIQRTLVSLDVAAFDRDAADADQDGGLTILDATAIQRHLVKLPTNPHIGTVV